MTLTTGAQFGTVAQVEIIPPFSDGVLINPDLTGRAQQLRVDWSVSKGVGLPATCEVKVYNMKKTSRDRCGGIVKRIVDFSDEFAFLDGRLVTGDDLGGSTVSTANGMGTLKLRARYAGAATTASLFEGTATFVDSVHRRHTWITKITGGDGVLQNSAAIADKAWSSTVTISEVVEYLVRRVMVSEIAAPLPASLATRSLAGGYDATNRYASDILDAFVALPGVNAEWWWDDGAVFFGTVGQPLPGAPIIVSPSGADGTYRMISKPQRTDTGEVMIQTLNLPQLRPKTAVTVLASELGGTYFATAIEHSGSNRGAGVSRTTARLSQIGIIPWL